MQRLTITTQIAAADAGVWQASGRNDFARVLRAARRHSRWVRRLRVAIPVVAGILLAGISLMALFNPLGLLSGLPVGADALVVSGSKITMQAPWLTGFTSDRRGYEMRAQTAAQDLTNPTLVELSGITARVELQDKAVVDLTALTGTYDAKAERLRLTKDIQFVSSNGYEGRLAEAMVDIRTGQIVSDKPVEMQMLNGVVTAGRLEVVEQGALVRFGGGVAMTVRPSAATSGGPPQEAQR
jgi:lipopolysaccharide export system protein LptC